MKVFVTVGTTKFEKLIEKICEKEFQDDQNCEKLTVQYGKSKRPKITIASEVYDYKPSIKVDLREADVIISAGGSGTILESLELQKNIIVVVNTDLMDNHQQELVDQLVKDGYIVSCSLDGLQDGFKKKQSKKWESGDNRAVLDIIDQLMK
ncbi:hypothetical protein HK103_007392 [Boothiomyces macroporosus]|uniref:UDP-N-acetylglucosamine transferase subunit ALG13 n=1 Tax=Boothiomyces macroporosus TaxID=261099 RepID=A0AAD5UKZ2_9FUNG|nr:hypothetical protein HK103_007392 [Boothiomyces macroporosus]